jgi:hypothetical protein
MSVHEIIVSYRQIDSVLGGRLESTLGGSEAAGEEVTPEMVARLTTALQALEKEERRPGVMASAQDELSSLLQTYLAREAARSGGLESLDEGGLEAMFDQWDVRWITTLFSWWKGLKPHPFLAAPAEPERLPNPARVALLADWGSGLYGAPVCAQTIAREAGYQLVMHLGDIYYSGDDDEVRDRFLQFWPRVPGAVSRALNGNHEMYTGGKAYFTQILPEFGQQASYYSLQNEYWTLVGLDTAYEDHDLTGEQVLWLERVVRQAGDRRIILFSHHQPYSLLDKQGPKLLQKLGALLAEKRIFAWYWGHEHRCVLYDQHPLWGLYGRCIGHSGFPYFRDGLGPCPPEPEWTRLRSKNLVPSGLLLDGPNPYIKGRETEYGPNGFVVLEFSGRQLKELVLDADGTVLRKTDLA